MRSHDPGVLFDQARAGDRGALARLLSVVERGGPPARDVARLVHPLGGRAHVVGLTGAPGAGKSTLTDALVGLVRSAGDDVAVLAVDPSSPLTGGAILGDRVRMAGHTGDDGTYIRSMANRGHLGGLALAVPEALRVLDAVGFPWVLLETVGVGQVEVAVVGAADTVVVMVTPGWGDAVQANKAGLLEVADVFVVNKADRPGADASANDLEQMLQLTGVGDLGVWRPPIVLVSAVTGAGVDDVWSAVGGHRAHLQATGGLAGRRRARLAAELGDVFVRRLEERASQLAGAGGVESLVDEVVAGRLDPWAAADQLLRTVL